MRWIDRGPEPKGVEVYDQRFTRGWVAYFGGRLGERPNDSYWREFRGLLSDRSASNCWYCERLCFLNADEGGKAPTVDHFRPLSRFPALAYNWSNWVFSCRRCNVDCKKDEWPTFGYVNPSADIEQERPEQYFGYDIETGEIIPKTGLSSEARGRALRTISDLGLNDVDVRFYRLDWTRQFIADWQALPISDGEALVKFIEQTRPEFVGSALMAVRQLQGSQESG